MCVMKFKNLGFLLIISLWLFVTVGCSEDVLYNSVKGELTPKIEVNNIGLDKTFCNDTEVWYIHHNEKEENSYTFGLDPILSGRKIYTFLGGTFRPDSINFRFCHKNYLLSEDMSFLSLDSVLLIMSRQPPSATIKLSFDRDFFDACIFELNAKGQSFLVLCVQLTPKSHSYVLLVFNENLEICYKEILLKVEKISLLEDDENSSFLIEERYGGSGIIYNFN